jgi:gliding motility-associated-like protein
LNRFNFFSISFILLLCITVQSRNVFGLTPPESPPQVNYIENKNQWDSFIKYQAEFRGGKIFLEENRFTYIFYNAGDIQSMHAHEGKQIDAIHLHAIRVNPLNANRTSEISTSAPLSYHNNYFIGNDSSRWATDVRLFTSVNYKDIYPGIDMRFYSSSNDVKYDLIVKPGASTTDIKFAYEGVDKISLKDGNLILGLSVGDIVEEKPFAYQIVNNIRKEIKCSFKLENNILKFEFPDGYDKTIPLTIDPTLVFSSYTGSNADNWGFTATYDAAGNFYSGGNVDGFGYPVTTGAYQINYHGGGFSGNGFSCDIAIAKFNASGTTLLYATYLGGADNEQPQSLVVDANDELVIFGTTYSSNYPTTTGCYDNTFNGAGDIIISKLSSAGNALVASTYIGGSNDDGINTDPAYYTTGPLKYNYSDEARGEIIANSNNDYILGTCSQSSNFPTTPGSYHPGFYGGFQDGVVLKINSSLTSLSWSTYIGGTSYDAVYDVAIDMNGNLFISGGTNSANYPTTTGVLHSTYRGGTADGFITHLNSDASAVIASTFIGTASYDQTFFVELDYNGFVYCTGQTEGSYPVTPGVYANANGKQFIHKLDSSLTTTVYSTVFGNGSFYPNISPTAFLVDTCENVYVAGWGRCLSFSSFTPGDVFNMPVTNDAFQSSTDGCDFYFFVLTKDALSLAYATYFGGNLSQEHVDGGTSRFDKNGVIYEAVCAGCGGNSDFPTTTGVVSNSNNSVNCNNGAIKLAFNLAKTVSSITTTPSSGCAPFTLTFINNSVNSVNYIWDFGDGTPQSTQVTPTHTFVNPGNYNVMLIALNTNSCNQNDTSYAQITVTSIAPQQATFTVNQGGVCDSFIVNTQVTSNWGHVYDWNFGDGFDTTGINPTHIYSDTGWFQITLIVKDTTCMMNTDTVVQNINLSGISSTANVSALNPLTGCTPVNISFSNNSTTGGNHFWDFGDGSPADTAMNIQHTFFTPGLFHVMFVVSDSLSCNSSDTAFVDVTVYPLVPVVPSFNSVLIQDCILPAADFNFDGAGGNVYTWNLGDGTNVTGTNISHTYSSIGNYTITLTVDDTLCGSTVSVSKLISFYPPLSASVAAIGPVNGCAPLNVSFTNNSTSGSMSTWNYLDGSPPDFTFNANHTFNTAGVYNVQYIIADSNSCNRADTDVVQVTVLPSIPVNASFALNEINYCDSTDASMSFNGSGGNIYHWNFGDGTTALGTSFNHHYDQPGRFDITLVVEDSICNKFDSVSGFVTVRPYLHADIDMGPVIFGCTPQVVNFSNVSHSMGNYYWDFGDNTISKQESIEHTYTLPGVYNIRFIVSDTTSCNGGDTALYNLHVYDSPAAGFSFEQHDNYFFSDVDFYNHSSPNSVFYRWNFSDSLTDTTSGPLSHRYNEGGVYNVCLYVMTVHGCVDTTCENIIVEDAETIYVPNAFSPNADGINDFFKVYSTGITEMDVIIYNRWGEKIYEYFTPEGRWDGRCNGKPSPEDVYVYKVLAKGLVHDNIEKTGKVSLIY